MLSLIKTYEAGSRGRATPNFFPRRENSPSRDVSEERTVAPSIGKLSTSGAVKALNTPHWDDMHSREINFATCSGNVSYNASALIGFPFIVEKRYLTERITHRLRATLSKKYNLILSGSLSYIVSRGFFQDQRSKIF